MHRTLRFLLFATLLAIAGPASAEGNTTTPSEGSGSPPPCPEGTVGPEWDGEYWVCWHPESSGDAGGHHNETAHDPGMPPTCEEGMLGPEYDAEGGYWYCY
ncbi:MAG TPA: hypothetical protein VNZ52_09200, partial [Candidatus Thermoplasmatota archaeon]|nr:hypothetical protein [Candidatus Thermoplasmatota archaeon]